MAANGIVTLDTSKVASSHVVGDRNKRVVVSFGDNPTFVAGRRAWIKYRELGVSQASGGALRAQLIIAEPGENQPTGWHLHHCDMQFLYVLKGAIHIAFNPDDVIRLQAGDSVMIPGGTMHMELGQPEGAEVLELSVPADMGTEQCSPPWADVNIDMNMARRS